jgi:hypothetical protein
MPCVVTEVTTKSPCWVATRLLVLCGSVTRCASRGCRRPSGLWRTCSRSGRSMPRSRSAGGAERSPRRRGDPGRRGPGALYPRRQCWPRGPEGLGGARTGQGTRPAMPQRSGGMEPHHRRWPPRVHRLGRCRALDATVGPRLRGDLVRSPLLLAPSASGNRRPVGFGRRSWVYS